MYIAEDQLCGLKRPFFCINTTGMKNDLMHDLWIAYMNIFYQP